MKKAALHNLGCKVNAYETEAMKQMLMKNGYEIVPFSEVADVYIVNTCSVTNIADRKSRQMLHKAKKMNKDAVVVACGCYAQTSTEKALEDVSIDLVLGNNKKKDIVAILNEYFEKQRECEIESATDSEKQRICATDSEKQPEFEQNKEQSNYCETDKNYVIDINKTVEYEELEIDTVTEHTRAHLKIQDGCNNFCSYCIIPYARGRIRSRNLDNIICEVKRLAKNGFKEIVLTGINLSCYRDENNTLIDVIEAINQIEGIERIRLGSLDPEVVTEEFAKRLSKVDKICPHFHLSLQSGCNKTLKMMNRHYTTEQYLEICNRLRNYFEEVAITTDVIVGFPQETEEDYQITRAFVEKIKFAELHVFKYSKRNGTVAAKMDGQVDEQIKSLRSDDLISLGEKLTKQYRNKKKGQSVEVLFEEQIEVDGKSYFVGHTRDYVKIAVESKEDIAGKIQNVTIIDDLSHEIMLATL